MQPTGNRQLAMQAFAERAGQGNPAQGGMSSQSMPQRPPAGQPPTSQPPTMSSGGIKQLQQSAPDEALLIVKALIQRLRELTRAEFGEKEPSQPNTPPIQ